MKLAVVLKVHPRGVTFGHVDRLLRHVLQVDDARLHHLLGLNQVLGGVVAWSVKTPRGQLSDLLNLVLVNWSLARCRLLQSLVGLEHLLEDEE